ncbi:MAG TPA: PilZ domain-containing protein [Lachnospiraceae bacterium]|nr:PilZ domain-containing protein [Lachnospiraceae bacterium]
MGLLKDFTNATLFHMDCSFFTSVRFTRLSLESARFYFPAAINGGLPAQFFMMPDDKQYDFRAFIYTPQGEPQPCTEDSSWWQVDGITNDIPELQSNFRVYVSFRTSIWLDKESRERTLTIKDIGTGGFLFVSKTEFTPGDTLSALLPDARDPVFVKARIQKRRPVRREGLFGYGCQFLNLTAKAEGKIRKFVYQTEVLQAKIKEQKNS